MAEQRITALCLLFFRLLNGGPAYGERFAARRGHALAGSHAWTAAAAHVYP